MTNDLRVELRVRNAALWHVIFDCYASVADFCRAMNRVTRQAEVGEYLNLTRSPYRSDGRLARLPRDICDFTGVGADELFPPDLYRAVIGQTRLAVDVPHHRVVALTAAMTTHSPLSLEDDIGRRELREAITGLMKTLRPQEEQVLRLRFGLDDGEPRTLADVGLAMGISAERVRWIEGAALRKLRKPSRMTQLEPHL